MIILRLVLAEARRNWLRLAIAVVTVGAAIALVTWTLGTVATARAQNRVFLRSMVGDADAWIVPDKPDPFSAAARGRFGMQTAPADKPRVWGVPEELVAQLRADERVRQVDAYPLAQVQIDYRPEGRLFAGPRPRGGVTGTDTAQCPYGADLVEGSWIHPGTSTGEVQVVVSAGLFFRSPPAVGESVTLLSTRGSVTARIVGRIRQQRAQRSLPTLFVSTADFEEHFREVQPGRPPYDVALLRLREPGLLAGFRAAWESRLREGGFPCRLEDPQGALAQMDERASMMMMRSAPLLLGLAGVATICIIITTLSLGVRHRIHTLAMLRAIGAERRHVFQLVLAEGALVAALGGALGVLGGWVALKIMSLQMPAAFPAGVALDRATIVGAAVCALLGVVGAAALPAVQAARLRPLDVLQHLYMERAQVPLARTVCGVVLLLPAPVLALHLPLPADVRCKLLLYVALPALVIGCILVAPLVVRVAERLVGWLVCRLAGVNPKLLSQPLSRQMGRAVGTAVTISLGLGLYTAIETWGSSMLQPFLPSPGFPDVIVSFLPGGVATNRLPAVLAGDGLRTGESFPFEAEQFLLDDATLDRIRANREYELKQNNVLVLGVDPDKAFGSAPAMFNFRFTAGDAPSAARRLAAGGACVVPAMFAGQSRCRVGDRIGLRVPVRGEGTNAVVGERTENLEIVGIADMNWHLITARANLRGQDGNPFATLSPVIVSYAQARAISSHDDRVRFVWANIADDLRALQVEDAVTELQNRLTRVLAAGGRPMTHGEAPPGGEAPRAFGPPSGGGGEGRMPPGGGVRGRGRGPGAFVQVSYRDFVVSGTVRHADDLIGNMSRIPLWALGILSLSIVNAVVASVQTRRVEIGRMRAIGLSRSQLLRLVCAEGLLIGVASVLLSLLFGIESGWCFTGYTRGTMAFGGLPVSFHLPLAHLLMANALAVGLSLAAAVVPAWLIARQEPASLLHAGTPQ